MRHPLQPIELDAHGTVRFRRNKIIEWLFNTGKLDLNHIGWMAAYGFFDDDDQMQLAMLLGYSVSGFGDLSFADPAVVAEADRKVEEILKGRGLKSGTNCATCRS